MAQRLRWVPQLQTQKNYFSSKSPLLLARWAPTLGYILIHCVSGLCASALLFVLKLYQIYFYWSKKYFGPQFNCVQSLKGWIFVVLIIAGF